MPSKIITIALLLLLLLLSIGCRNGGPENQRGTLWAIHLGDDSVTIVNESDETVSKLTVKLNSRYATFIPAIMPGETITIPLRRFLTNTASRFDTNHVSVKTIGIYELVEDEASVPMNNSSSVPAGNFISKLVFERKF